MVRLKERPTRAYSVLNLFQFHYGTIKRPHLCRRNGRVRLFQFHYGTIKSQAAQRYSLWQDAFQFHYGTIKSAVETFSELRLQISIPLWYD